MVIRLCEYCGKEFEAHGNQRYCSEICSAKAAKEKRREYLKKHPEILQKQLEYDRARRQKLKEAVLEDKHNKISAQNHIDLVRRQKIECVTGTNNGDKGRCNLLNGGNTTIEYWNAFKEKELKWCERMNTSSNCVVNNVSVYSDVFAEMVVASIKVTSLIRVESYKRG